jgi:hypothetical protein
MHHFWLGDGELLRVEGWKTRTTFFWPDVFQVLSHFTVSFTKLVPHVDPVFVVADVVQDLCPLTLLQLTVHFLDLFTQGFALILDQFRGVALVFDVLAQFLLGLLQLDNPG